MAIMTTLDATFRDACSRVRGEMGPKADLVALEELIRAELDALGRELLREAHAAADVDTPTVVINGVLHSRVRRFQAPLHTTFGAIEVWKTTYQPDRKTKPVCATDLVLGIVEDFYTPKCAKILCLLTALAVREEVEAIVGAFGGMSMGSATMYRIPQAVIARYETRRDLIEYEVRARSEIPPSAAIVQFGLDGVMVPQEGEHCDPRGRTPKGDPDPPRHERRVGTLPASPRDHDGTEGVAWHEASVATAAFFDAEGRHLMTTYIGRMPDEHKAILSGMLRDEAMSIVRQREDLKVVLASDGAVGQWASLAELYASLPPTMQPSVVWLIDFFHVAEYLQGAAAAIFKDAGDARVLRVQWCEMLKAYEDGADRVRQSLRHYRRKATRAAEKKGIDKALTYFKNNRTRMGFHAAQLANLPLATGPTEAAAKSLVGIRMKRSGARYGQHGGQTILTLLAAFKSARFDTLWDVLGEGYAANVVVPRAA
jgi:hypothetical protein